MKKKMIGFIGAGNMAEALIRGLLGVPGITAGSILFSEPRTERAAALKKTYKIRKAADNSDLVRKSEVIFLAVKPQAVNAVLREVGPALDRTRLLISVAAGVSLFQIESRLRSPVRIARVMPNTPALIGEGATAVCYGHLATRSDRAFIRTVFSAVGRAVELNESLMDAVTGLSGSGPAYVFSFIQGLADGGVQAGLPRETALELAAQTVLGAARMVLEDDRHPLELRDQVASPGGTTIQGIAVLEEKGFKGILMEAVRKAVERSRQLSQQ